MKEGETRTYTVPLRREYLKTPKWRRAEKAITTLRTFVIRHSKSEEVRIGQWVNQAIWKRGAKNPPSRVRVDVKMEKDHVIVELSELPKKAINNIETEKEDLPKKEIETPSIKKKLKSIKEPEKSTVKPKEKKEAKPKVKTADKPKLKKEAKPKAELIKREIKKSK